MLKKYKTIAHCRKTFSNTNAGCFQDLILELLATMLTKILLFNIYCFAADVYGTWNISLYVSSTLNEKTENIYF